MKERMRGRNKSKIKEDGCLEKRRKLRQKEWRKVVG
jgi:hypothetical protein